MLPLRLAPLLSLADVDALEPVPTGLAAAEAARVIGAQCNVWTEHMDSMRAVEYMAFPRLCASAEVVWSNRTDPVAEYEDLRAHLAVQLARLDALGVAYRPQTGPQPWQIGPQRVGLATRSRRPTLRDLPSSPPGSAPPGPHDDGS
jgi:hexosaminidase